MPVRLATLARFLRFIGHRFAEDRCSQIASSLAFTTLLSLVPLLVIALTVVSAFPVFSEWMTQVKIFLLANMLPEAAGKIITVYMVQFSEKAAHLTGVGIAALAVTAFMLMLTIEHAFNLIWKVKTGRPVLQRILTYWAVITLGPLSIGASLSLTSFLLSRSLVHVSFIPLLGVMVLKIVPFLIMIGAFTLLYMVVPNRAVPLKHAAIGGILAGVGMGLMNMGFAAYILHFTSYTFVYGAFASLPVFLLWLYASWLIVITGALAAASISHWGSACQTANLPGRQFQDALHVLSSLGLAQRRGVPVSLQGLQLETRLELDEIEALLPPLQEAGMVERTDRQSFMLARAAADIALADVFRCLVFSPGASTGSDTFAIQEVLNQISSSLNNGATGSLDDMLGRAKSEPEIRPE
ncbi:MAG: YihY family inner membrane protein [Sulfuricellaceae bacterium]|nr:YihY family inner membrane protein [Sulfuricellaceae bacterium]